MKRRAADDESSQPDSAEDALETLLRRNMKYLIAAGTVLFVLAAIGVVIALRK